MVPCPFCQEFHHTCRVHLSSQFSCRGSSLSPNPSLSTLSCQMSLRHVQTVAVRTDTHSAWLTASDAQLILLYKAQHHTSYRRARRCNLSVGTEVFLDIMPASITASSYCHTCIQESDKELSPMDCSLKPCFKGNWQQR